MKKGDKFRFSLQFGSETEEQRGVGELLERLGNRKSAVIVAAVNEYMLSHPEINSNNSKIEVKLTSGITYEEIKEMLRSMINEKLADLKVSGAALDNTSSSDSLTEDIDKMLDNLDLF